MTHSVPCLLAVSSCALDRISLGNSAVDQTYHFCRISLLSAVSTHCFGVLFGRKVSIEWMGHINKRPYIITNEVRFHCGSIFLRRCQRCCSGIVSAVQRKSERNATYGACICGHGQENTFKRWYACEQAALWNWSLSLDEKSRNDHWRLVYSQSYRMILEDLKAAV